MITIIGIIIIIIFIIVIIIINKIIAIIIIITTITTTTTIIITTIIIIIIIIIMCHASVGAPYHGYYNNCYHYNNNNNTAWLYLKFNVVYGNVSLVTISSCGSDVNSEGVITLHRCFTFDPIVSLVASLVQYHLHFISTVHEDCKWACVRAGHVVVKRHLAVWGRHHVRTLQDGNSALDIPTGLNMHVITYM